MAEALLNRLGSEHFEVTSAGIERGEMHPLTVDVMRAIGIDMEGRVSKGIHDVLRLDFDFVITLCDRSRPECRKFPEAERVHWRLDDPLTVLDCTKQERLFQSLRDQISQRVRLFALVQVRFAPVDTSSSRSAFSA